MRTARAVWNWCLLKDLNVYLLPFWLIHIGFNRSCTRRNLSHHLQTTWKFSQSWCERANSILTSTGRATWIMRQRNVTIELCDVQTVSSSIRCLWLHVQVENTRKRLFTVAKKILPPSPLLSPPHVMRFGNSMSWTENIIWWRKINFLKKVHESNNLPPRFLRIQNMGILISDCMWTLKYEQNSVELWIPFANSHSRHLHGRRENQIEVFKARKHQLSCLNFVHSWGKWEEREETKTYLRTRQTSDEENLQKETTGVGEIKIYGGKY